MFNRLFKNSLVYVIICLLLVTITSFSTVYAEETEFGESASFSYERIIVKKRSSNSRFMPSSDPYCGIEVEEVKTIKRQKAQSQLYKFSLLAEDNNNGDILVLTLKDKGREEVLNAIEILNNSPDIVYAQPNYIRFPAQTPNDTHFNTYQSTYPNNSLSLISAPAAWDKEIGNEENPVLVGVLDTGVDINHEDLIDNIWTNPTENGNDEDGNGFTNDIHGWNFAEDNNNVWDIDGHGTHVSGIIGAKGCNGKGVAGVIWNVKIVPLRIFANITNPNTGKTVLGAYDEWIISALEYANMMGINITNNSYGGYEDTPGESQALKDAIEDSGLFIAAAGNESKNNDVKPFIPASYDLPNIISVANIKADDYLASSSCYGINSVDIAAPGNGIFSTIRAGAASYKVGENDFTTGYNYKSGTSMACPHVAGAAALLSSFNPTLTNAQLKQYILDSADTVANLNGLIAGSRRLNVNAMLVEPYSIAFAEETVALNITDTLALAPAILPINANSVLLWESSDPSVVSVDEGGEIEALAFGMADITISDERWPTTCATIKVFVLPEADTFKTQTRILQNETLKSNEIAKEDTFITVYAGNNTSVDVSATFLACIYSEDNRLIDIVNMETTEIISEEGSTFSFTVNGTALANADKMKFFVWDSSLLDGYPLDASEGVAIVAAE